MATYTTYKSLEKPLSVEKYDVAVANKNNDVIDSELHKLDIKNQSQDELLATKEALNFETTRATAKEEFITNELDNEILRAKSSENELSNNIMNEINRAIMAENTIGENLDNHNSSTSAHMDIRELISGLTTRLNALADSDDTTLDQLSEIVAYIKNNKTLIDSITTSKVNTFDIIDSLDYSDTDKPLSANQGKVLKGIIKSLTKSDFDLDNVENKSSETIRNELTKENVINALGYTPPAINTTYSVASASADGLMSKTDKTKLDSLNIAYATCDTEAATSSKVITISDNQNWELKLGAIICVKYSATNTATNCTLNVNKTGSKQVWYNNAVNTGSSNVIFGYANRHIWYLYNGTYWVWMGHGSDNNTTYSNATLGQGYGTCTTSASTVAKVVTLSNYALVTNGIVAIKFTNSVPASATMNINGKGAKPIYYKGVAIISGIINAGSTATFIYNGSQYHLLAVDISNFSANNTGITYSDTEPTTLSTGMTWIGN